MQILKDEVKEKIHKAAVIEFKERGFHQSSMRNIAKRAGMTVGNLYRYFKNKENLFYTVVGPAFDKIVTIINESKRFNLKENNQYYNDNFIEYIINRILEIYKQYKFELLILLNGSKGTKYERGKEEIILLMENRIKNDLFPEMKDIGIIIEDIFLAHVIAVSFVEGLFMILRHYEEEIKMENMIKQFISFYFKDIVKRFD